MSSSRSCRTALELERRPRSQHSQMARSASTTWRYFGPGVRTAKRRWLCALTCESPDRNVRPAFDVPSCVAMTTGLETPLQSRSSLRRGGRSTAREGRGRARSRCPETVVTNCPGPGVHIPGQLEVIVAHPASRNIEGLGAGIVTLLTRFDRTPEPQTPETAFQQGLPT